MISPAQAETTGTTSPDARALGQVWCAVLIAAVLWFVSSQGYSALVEACGLKNGYDGASVLLAAYYLVWMAVSVWLFRDLIVKNLKRRAVAHEVLASLPILSRFTLFAIYVLPLLPKVSGLRAPSEPLDFMFASVTSRRGARAYPTYDRPGPGAGDYGPWQTISGRRLA